MNPELHHRREGTRISRPPPVVGFQNTHSRSRKIRLDGDELTEPAFFDDLRLAREGVIQGVGGAAKAAHDLPRVDAPGFALQIDHVFVTVAVAYQIKVTAA